MRRRARAVLLLSLAAALAAPLVRAAPPAVPMPPRLPPLREQDRIRQEWLKARLERVLPALMRRHGVAMWIVASREYNEDPAFFSLVSPSVMAARRRTILVFHDRGLEEGVERLTLGGGSSGGLYKVYRDPDAEGRELMGAAQWNLLRRLVDERKPATIAIDVSHTHAFSDGLSAGEREQLESALGPWTSRLVRAEGLPLDYIATRVPEMLPVYRQLMATSHALIARAFSSEVIMPGRTTTEDVVWWLRQQVNDLGLGEWFAPSVTVQRRGQGGAGQSRARPGRGRRHRDRARRPPAHRLRHLRHGPGHGHAARRLRAAQRRERRSGRAARGPAQLQPAPGPPARAAAAGTLRQRDLRGHGGRDEGGRASTARSTRHPIGDHGHGAGPIIGLWDRQEAIPGRGDVLVLPSTWFSIELQATTPVAEWGGQAVRSAQEEDVAIDADGNASWVLARQEKYHLVR